MNSRWRQPTRIYSDRIESTTTEYHGVMMRSRLERDFAFHLDLQGIQWQYEPRIFGPRGKGYLPDFQIDREDGAHFIEVKPTLEEVPLARERMEVIWKTHPEAVLVVACAEESRFFAATVGHGWVSWVDRWKHL